ncbi:MAG: hypothetical protein KAJ19_25445 [Gammaproteobacteria bacterium]|nr:hypothetical protein [Gammaproteobacteria bacterium]
MMFIGIDPGVTGAIAVIPADNVTRVWDTPTTRVKGKRCYDIPGMHTLLCRALTVTGRGEGVIVALEQQQAFPGQGRTSMFKIGHGFGLWEGLLVAVCMPYEIVRPQRWKKALLDGLPSKDKGSSRIVAARLFPDVDLGNRKDQGRADALLLAEFALRLRA